MIILAIGAHHDDYELGCGGTLHKYSSKGATIHSVIVTDGYFYDTDGNELRNGKKAKEESLRASEILGIKKVEYYGLRIHEVCNDENLRTRLLNTVSRVSPDLIFTHWFGDVHHDHRAVS